MRSFFIVAIMLSVLACVDLHYSKSLLAQFQTATDAMESADQNDHQPRSQSLHSDVELVETALNSRYMQWGAVGVMLWLFVWIITKQQPRQEAVRNTERQVDREAFLTSLNMRDEQYLEALSEIRKSVEAHSERHYAAKESLSRAVNELTSQIRSSR